MHIQAYYLGQREAALLKQVNNTPNIQPNIIIQEACSPQLMATTVFNTPTHHLQEVCSPQLMATTVFNTPNIIYRRCALHSLWLPRYSIQQACF